MKIIKGPLFFVAAIVFGSCFDPPQHPAAPEIRFDRVEYVDGVLPDGDMLTLYLNFKDGDGDLGLDAGDLRHRNYPYNDAFFYLGNNGQLTEVSTYSLSTEMQDIIDIPDQNQDKLVFPRTGKKAGFSNLPSYEANTTCTIYNFRRVLIESEDLNAIRTDDRTKFDPYIRFTDTVSFMGRRFYEIEDTLYFKVNPDHYNIEVDFLVREPQNPEADADGYVEYDWRMTGCNQRGTLGQAYDGRFITLSDESGPLEGRLRYTMNNLAFTETFNGKTLKLRVQVKDRALNKSNIVTSTAFTLD